MEEKYFIIDSHNHIGKSLWQEFFAEDLLKKMDAANQDMAVIFSPTINAEYKWKHNYYASNDYIADMQKKYPNRFIGLGTINPWYQNNMHLSDSTEKNVKIFENATLNEIDRCIFDLGLRGFKFHPNQHGYSFNDPILIPPIFDKILSCQKKLGKKLYIVVHMWVIDSFCSMEKLAMVASNYPELTFAAAHCGDGFGGEATIEIVKKYKNIILDFTYTTNPINKLKEFIKEIDVTRIVAGSDQCYNTFEIKMQIIDTVVKSEEHKKLILGENLRNFFEFK